MEDSLFQVAYYLGEEYRELTFSAGDTCIVVSDLIPDQSGIILPNAESSEWEYEILKGSTLEFQELLEELTVKAKYIFSKYHTL